MAIEEEQSRRTVAPEKVGGIVTNLIKLGGLVVALNEVFAHQAIRPGAIAISALMMAGAQSLETFLTAFFNAPQQQGKKD